MHTNRGPLDKETGCLIEKIVKLEDTQTEECAQNNVFSHLIHLKTETNDKKTFAIGTGSE